MVCYLKGSPTKDLLFPSYLVTYCVADWRSCVDLHRSMIRFCIFLGDALVSWKMKKQCTVSRSSAVAEYHSMGPSICEFKWISYILCDFGTVVLRPFLCIAIIRPPYISRPTRCLMNEPSTWTLTVTLFVIVTKKGFHVANNLLTCLPKFFWELPSILCCASRV